MTDEHSKLNAYFNPLTAQDRRQLEERAERHRDRLEQQGFQVSVAQGEHGLFAGVLVIDVSRDRVGFLEDDGTVTWITGTAGGIGALGSAVVQNPSEALNQELDESDHVDVD